MVDGGALEHVMVVSGIGGDEGRHQRRAHGGRFWRSRGGGVFRHEKGQIVPGDPALPWSQAHSGKPFNKFGNIEPHVDGLLHRFHGSVFIETDEALAPFDWRGD